MIFVAVITHGTDVYFFRAIWVYDNEGKVFGKDIYFGNEKYPYVHLNALKHMYV